MEYGAEISRFHYSYTLSTKMIYLFVLFPFIEEKVGSFWPTMYETIYNYGSYLFNLLTVI